MSNSAYHDISLEEVLAFNDALLGLAATGLPIELEAGDTNEQLQKKLPEINARLALQVGRGQSLPEVLASDREISPRYRAALATWLRGSQPTEALDALALSARGRREVAASVRYSLLQPLIILALVYAGFIYLVLTVAPKLEAIYRQLWQAPNPGLQALLIAKDWLPVWGPLLPLMLLLFILAWRWGALPSSYAWLPARNQYLDALSRANYADSVARLLESGFSLGQALELLGPLPVHSVDAGACKSATDRIIDADLQGQRVAWDDPAVKPLPPLLRWAFTGDLVGQPMSAVLRIVAQNYRATARRQSALLRWWLPTLVGAFLGGVLVCAFAVSLFWPMVELLRTLTKA